MDVVIAGLCNVYTHYITTYEEYQVTDSVFPIWDDNSCEIMHTWSTFPLL